MHFRTRLVARVNGCRYGNVNQDFVCERRVQAVVVRTTQKSHESRATKVTVVANVGVKGSHAGFVWYKSPLSTDHEEDRQQVFHHHVDLARCEFERHAR